MTKEVEIDVTDLEKTIANMTQNQQGLVKDNDQLRGIISDLQKGNSIPMIFSKMLAVKRDIGSVGKDQKNTGQGWQFRGIDQFINALHPILNKHGVGISTKCIQHAEPKFILNEKTGKTAKNTHITMEYIFFAEDGSTISTFMPAEGVDPGDKGTNKALSAAFKYALIQTFCVPTEDMAEADLENATVDGGSGKAGAARKPAVKAAKSPAASADKKSFRKPRVVPDTVASSDEL